MKITVIGTGYVGLVSGTCLADVGNDVLCLDVDANKIRILNEGGIPIYEPGLEAMVRRNKEAGRLRFTTDVAEAVAHGTIQFIAVGTPPDEDGSADLQYVVAAARSIGQHMNGYKVIVDKSTVPVGTADKVRAAIAEELKARGAAIDFSVVSNPEFLKEGAAVEDFMKPDRIVVGAEDARAIDLMRQLYAPFQRNHERLIVMDVRSAELTKYAANAMLATRISFMNELANLAEKLGADIELVRQGIGSDPRIGYHFLYPGCGYGGSCFPKDVQALMRTAREAGQGLKILQSVEEANEEQKYVLANKIVKRLGEDLSGKTIALWGLAFKPNTDDMREAPSRVLIDELFKRGAKVRAYDPVATHEAQRIFGDEPRLAYAETPMDALEGADVLAIVTEWKEFRAPDFDGDEGEAEDAGDLRRAQPLRSGAAARGGPRIFRHRTQMSELPIPDTSAARILIVGDVMLDRYWFGDVSRISPEAPVPVVKVERTEERPGGAANVARNCAALGARTGAAFGRRRRRGGAVAGAAAGGSKIDASLHEDAQLNTTVKLRVLGRQQQLLRIDFENSPAHEVLHAKLAEFEERLPACDVVILSDYGKGGLAHIAEMIRLARAAGKPVLVDPKGEDYARYAGATVLTPNRCRIAPGGRPLEGRGRPRVTRRTAARGARLRGPAGDALRGGHDAVLGGRRTARAGPGARSL